jgi:DNA polymerase bacteriophage-type
MSNLIVLDFETYFDKDYSLRKQNMTYERYIQDERFKVQMLAIKVNDNPTEIVIDDIKEVLQKTIGPEDIVVAHNYLFDGAILSFHYGITPNTAYCTQAMGRAIFPFGTNSLDGLAQQCFPDGTLRKGEGLMDTKGKVDLTPEEISTLGTYATQDVDVTFEIFRYLYSFFPSKELAVMNLTLQMYTHRTVTVDQPLVEQYLCDIKTRAHTHIRESGLEKSVLSSSKKFSEWVLSQGIEFKQIPSPTLKNPHNMKWPLSKNDLEFIQLQERHPEYKHVWDARLAVASRQEETRAETFLVNSSNPQSLIGVPLNYAGAHTLRWSGTNKVNLQNLGRGSPLRNALKAQPGYKLVIADSSNIEARLLAWFAEETRLLYLYSTGGDPYLDFAGQIFGPGLTKERNPTERFIGKTCVLGLGYGMGAAKLHKTFATGASGKRVDVSLNEAKHYVNTFRSLYPNIPRYWGRCELFIKQMLLPDSDIPERGLSVKTGGLLMPDGMYMRYPSLKAYHDHRTDRDVSHYHNGKHIVNIYGGKLTENIVQRAARCVLRDIMLDVQNEWCNDNDARIVLQVHDEIVVHTREDQAEQCKDVVSEIMCRTPAWADDTLVLDTEAEISDYYTKP